VLFWRTGGKKVKMIRWNKNIVIFVAVLFWFGIIGGMKPRVWNQENKHIGLFKTGRTSTSATRGALSWASLNPARFIYPGGRTTTNDYENNNDWIYEGVEEGGD